MTLENFQYEEEDRQGNILDSEEAYLPGVFLDLKAQTGKWFIASELHAMNGEADYYAYPSTDSELRSTTSESMKNLHISLGYSQSAAEKVSLEYSGGLGFRIWNRDIHSLPNIPGLDETYKWPYFSLGFRPVYHINSQNKLDFLLKAKRAFDATLEVEFKNEVYDSVSLDLDDGMGFEIEANWLQTVDANTTFGFGPYLHQWWFDESKPSTLTKNGVPVGRVYEPASYTRSFGIRLFIRKSF